MPRVDGLPRCEDDEAEWFFLAAQDLTTVQLRRARDIVSDALPDVLPSNEMLATVAQTFATNFAAIAISRKLPQDED